MNKRQTAKVPASRLSRFSSLGGLASRVAGNMLIDGARKLSQGQSPKLQDLVLTPKNIIHVAEKLAQMRGAAMKVGQMLSMDSGELMPKELSELLARLRSDAKVMPHKQLLNILKQNWGDDWLSPFSHFELRPFAAASIGQVHKAILANGTPLAIKIQYPGISDSIDSDIDNIATLLRVAKLVPKNVQFDRLLNEAKKQLHLEANYQAELNMLERYNDLMANEQSFIIPKAYPNLSSASILVMSFVDAQSIESVATLNQAVRNSVATELLRLFFRELFEFKLIQTDANFANFQYQQETARIVLLDFGATREIPCDLSANYLQLMTAAIDNHRELMEQAAQQIGFFQTDISAQQKSLILDIFHQACEPLRASTPYDFGSSTLAKRIKMAGMEMSTDADKWHTPPVDALFIHRKLAGIYLLLSRLNARVDAKSIFDEVTSSISQKK
ncbi:MULTISPECIES: AarF/ABC1/UbiB kinase family protein [unclassified Shewanella]|uniref:ABC1 kinase family protein n=1 Tax=unclassified Shewanella TaxID=196818 RepID=UPI001BC06E9D|nr:MULTISPECIES: AarF/ABC1/UbiB kinase family protein [unclassified Shewanella]GIU19721.1 ubiquinol-cytochrome c reductase [Shewanella sp. MBTL60-112-B1]GIU27675.1 ubiquinol-cytochrome c reductase [Shewanella sp. MBTL60-112-B2]